MHPSADKRLAAIVDPRPPDAVWCDECMRWECGGGTFKRPAVSWRANALGRFALLLHRIAIWFDHRARYIQAAHLVKRGEGTVGKPRPGRIDTDEQFKRFVNSRPRIPLRPPS